ncbi:MAG: glycosyltransferase family 4 protein [Alphaproteobacteria bacterium]|nr:glycosyltransferase family 4 protein [Alphaproteobacteria bacterium]
MKICQLCAVDFTMYHFLLPLMEGMQRAGHDVVGVCSPGELVGPVREAGFRVETVPIARSYDLRRHLESYAALLAFMRRERFDLVHVHTPVAALIGRVAAWRAGVPRIAYTAHGFYFHERMPRSKRMLFLALEWLAGRTTDVLFTQAEEDAATARRYRLCRGDIVTAIGNGVDPIRFESDNTVRGRVRHNLGVDEDTVVIVMVGRLVAEKGYPELFEAMRSVAAQLWVVGERLKSDHATAIDRALGDAQSDPDLATRVRFLGYRQDVPDLMRAADVFTLPSHREGMPRSIIEAMFAGLPVVATDIRGSREEVVDNETGLLVPVGDVGALARALSRLVGDPQARTDMGRAGRARAQALYNEADVVARQLDLLELA